MSVPSSTPARGIERPEDPEEAVAELSEPQGEDYGPPEVVDPDREADVADQVEQTIEVPVDDDVVAEGQE